MQGSMRVPTLLVTLLAALGLPTGVMAAEAAAPESGPADALLMALARVPDTPDVRQNAVSWLDQTAAAEARPGAARPASSAELEALLASDDPSGQLWLAAMQGASSGDPEVLQRLMSATRWPAELGFDFTDIGQHLFFGLPPADGSVLLGTFDPATVSAAFEARGYTATAADRHTLLCGPAGCEDGMAADLANADPGLPFGAQLGRSEPIAVSTTDILSSADFATLTAMLEAADGSVGSLADDPGYRAVASAADPAATLIQATLMPGGMVGLDPTVYARFSNSPEAAGELVVALDEAFEEMPAADAVAILDGATATEQVVSIALAYGDEADAAVAAEVLPRRFEALPSLSTGEPMAELLAERGVTSVSGRVVPGDDVVAPTAVVELRAPLSSPGPDGGDGRPAPSSRLYRLFTDLVFRGDLLWLAPVLPLE